MGWTAGADVSTGDLITAATWNNYLGATGSLEHVYDTSAAVILTTRGDILYEGAAGLARLAKGTQTYELAMGANDPEWVAPKKAKELYVPVTYATEMGAYVGYPVGRCDGAGDLGYISFRVPEDFNAITEAMIIVIPRATQAAANWDIRALHAATGEAYDTHDTSDIASTYNVVDEQIFEVDASTICAAITAGDIAGVLLSQAAAGHNVDVVGLFLRYT